MPKRTRLVLARKVHETIIVDNADGTETHFTIAAVHGKSVSVVIEAPPALKIHRAELDPNRHPDAALPATAVVPQSACQRAYIDAEWDIAGMFSDADGENSEPD